MPSFLAMNGANKYMGQSRRKLRVRYFTRLCGEIEAKTTFCAKQ